MRHISLIEKEFYVPIRVRHSNIDIRDRLQYSETPFFEYLLPDEPKYRLHLQNKTLNNLVPDVPKDSKNYVFDHLPLNLTIKMSSIATSTPGRPKFCGMFANQFIPKDTFFYEYLGLYLIGGIQPLKKMSLHSFFLN